MGLINRLFGKDRATVSRRRADELTRMIADIDKELASERDRIIRAHQSHDDAAMGNILIASVYEKMGQSPPSNTAGLGRVDELQAQRVKLETELAQVRDVLPQATPIPPRVGPKTGCCPYCGAFLLDDRGQARIRLDISKKNAGAQGFFCPKCREEFDSAQIAALKRAT